MPEVCLIPLEVNSCAVLQLEKKHTSPESVLLVVVLSCLELGGVRQPGEFFFWYIVSGISGVASVTIPMNTLRDKMMIEIRIHGRGGQGVVIASKVLAVAAAKEGKRVQSFPTFGPERRGAPVAAFARIDEKEIRRRYQIYHPDHVIVLDPVLHLMVEVTAG